MEQPDQIDIMSTLAMTDQELEAFAGGYHGDPFGVLGPHAISADGRNGWIVRAFLPQAKSVELALDGKTFPMERAHETGVFTARLDKEPGAYKFRITDHQDRV